jgi:hypothetical protein
MHWEAGSSLRAWVGGEPRATALFGPFRLGLAAMSYHNESGGVESYLSYPVWGSIPEIE